MAVNKRRGSSNDSVGVEWFEFATPLDRGVSLSASEEDEPSG
jgi:hypothetical protein